MTKLKKDDMIDMIIEGHVEDIKEWVLRDMDSLVSWLEIVLELEYKTKEELEEDYGSYLTSYEEEDDEEDEETED